MPLLQVAAELDDSFISRRLKQHSRLFLLEVANAISKLNQKIHDK